MQAYKAMMVVIVKVSQIVGCSFVTLLLDHCFDLIGQYTNSDSPDSDIFPQLLSK